MYRVILALSLAITVSIPAVSAIDFQALKAQGAQAVLAHGDQLHQGQATQKWSFRMTMSAPSGENRVVKFNVQQKGRKRLVRFTDGDPKGLSVLVSGSKMYVYSPQTDKVRRVASHARRQTFMGSNMTFSDMSSIELSTRYEASFGAETANEQWLHLTGKADASVDWKSLRVKIHKSSLSISRVEYFEGATLVRVQKRDGLSLKQGVPTYRRVVFEEVGTGHTTTMEMLSQVLGEPIADSVFKKRNLVRGN